MGNQPEVATRAVGLGNVQGGIDVPLCAGRLLCSGIQRIRCAEPTAHSIP